jgi:uncharacterized protein (TIGR02118 family)
MGKTIGLMPKRPDISRAAFRDHYENRHAPLALPLFPFTKYVRNHVVESDPDPVGFDCLSEFWVDDVETVHRLMASDVGDTMREDERRFTDQPRIAPAVAEETLVAGSPRGVDPTVVKEIILARPADGVDRTAFVDAILAWGKALAAGSEGQVARVTFDLVTPFEGVRFPDFQGILYAWTTEPGGIFLDAAPPDAVEIYARLKTESIETPL